MNKRLESKEQFGRNKSYDIDPAGAIRLQLLLAHHVEALRAKLGAGVHPDEEEITPLAFDDIEF